MKIERGAKWIVIINHDNGLYIVADAITMRNMYARIFFILYILYFTLGKYYLVSTAEGGGYNRRNLPLTSERLKRDSCTFIASNEAVDYRSGKFIRAASSKRRIRGTASEQIGKLAWRARVVMTIIIGELSLSVRGETMMRELWTWLSSRVAGSHVVLWF